MADNQFDPTNFNYQSAADQIARQRAMANLLLQRSQQGQQGQFIKNGDFIGYAGGNTPLSALLQGATAYAGAKTQSSADDAQKQLSDDSQRALAYQLQHLSDRVDVPYNAARDSEAANVAQALGVREPTVDTSGATAPQAVVTPPDVPATAAPNVAPAVASPRLSQQSNASPGVVAPSTSKIGALLREPETQQQIGERLDLARAAHRQAAQALQSWGSIQRSKDPAGFEYAKGYEARTRASLDALERKWQASLTADQLAGKSDVASPRSSAIRTALTGLLSTPAEASPTQQQTGPSQVVVPVRQRHASLIPAAAPQSKPQLVPGEAPQQRLDRGSPAAISNPVAEANPGQRDPTQAEMLSRYQQLSMTGPEGARLADMMTQSALAGKNGRYKTEVHADPVNGGFIQVVTDSQTGQTAFRPLSSGGEGGKVLETKEGPDGRLLERTAQGWRDATMNGKPVMTATGQKNAEDRESKRVEAFSTLNSLKAQRDRMTDLVPLIQSVGTGRLQTPWNEFKAYFTDSADLDRMNRAFSQQELEGAVQWLKGQGSVTEGERALLARSQFNPRADTQANVDYANMVLGMLNKHIPIAEAQYEKQYGTVGGSAKPAGDFMYSWQRK